MEKHFVLVSAPAHGHINPTLPLVEELIRRGHRVSYATGKAVLGAVEEAGANPVALPSTTPSAMPGQDVNARTLARMTNFLVEEIRSGFPPLLEHFRADPPDAVCCDMLAPSGRLLAQRLDVPQVSLMPSFASNEQFSLHDKMADRVDLQDPELLAAGRRFEEVTEQCGARTELFPMRATPAPVNVVFLPRRFQLGAETFDERFHFIGPCLGRRVEQGYRPADTDAPLLFVSLGTAFNNRPDIYRSCLEAFGGTDWQVAMSIGGTVELADLGTIPVNFDIRPSLPQLGVLRRASAFVTHNGMGSTMEALHYGVPQVGLPQMPEQQANAERVTELGLGRRLPVQEQTADGLRAAVDAVVADEQIRENLTWMRAEIRSAGGAVAGADAIETAAR